MAQVGFIGLGKMGLGMAGRLLSAGLTLSVYNRTPEKAARLVELGARSAATPRAAANANVIGCAERMAQERDSEDVPFSAELRLKDTGYGVQSIDQFSQAEEVGSAAQSAFQCLVDAGFGEFSGSKAIDLLGAE